MVNKTRISRREVLSTEPLHDLQNAPWGRDVPPTAEKT